MAGSDDADRRMESVFSNGGAVVTMAVEKEDERRRSDEEETLRAFFPIGADTFVNIYKIILHNV